MKLIVGLGNKGKEYDKTRHNVGFMAIDFLASIHNLTFDKEKFGGLYTSYFDNDEKIILLKPQKYMNLSGEVVRDFVDYFKIDVDDIFIIHDDLDLPVGKYKLRPSGKSGGHKGLKNIEQHLHTNKYKRMKIGISNNKEIDTKDYVLGKIKNEDLEIINDIIEKVPNIVNDFLNMSFDELMNKYNRK